MLHEESRVDLQPSKSFCHNTRKTESDSDNSPENQSKIVPEA